MYRILGFICAGVTLIAVSLFSISSREPYFVFRFFVLPSLIFFLILSAILWGFFLSLPRLYNLLQLSTRGLVYSRLINITFGKSVFFTLILYLIVGIIVATYVVPSSFIPYAGWSDRLFNILFWPVVLYVWIFMQWLLLTGNTV